MIKNVIIRIRYVILVIMIILVILFYIVKTDLTQIIKPYYDNN